MTKREREDLQKAVRFLMDTDNGWDDGVRILLRLAGMTRVAYTAIDTATSVPFISLIGVENQPFSYTPSGDNTPTAT